jgi:hypothetical protein
MVRVEEIDGVLFAALIDGVGIDRLRLDVVATRIDATAMITGVSPARLRKTWAAASDTAL